MDNLPGFNLFYPMNLQRIRETIAAYGQEFPIGRTATWQIQKTFQDHWDSECP